ncbi:MAG: GTPase [Myxococcota bacterium]
MEEAMAAAEGLVDPAPLHAALGWLQDPWRIVVFGRVAAGKTTWLNAITGTSAPTGLGGVTEASVEIDGGGRIYVDTPGIDNPDHAVLELQPLMDTADAAVWIVDGLQPLTASERDVANVVLSDANLSIIVTKIDLVEDHDRKAVLARIRDLSEPLSPTIIRAINAREEKPLPGLPGPPSDLSPRRRRILADAVGAMRAAMPSPPPRREDVEAAWAGAVRTQVQEVEAAIDREAIHQPSEALRALRERSEPALRALRQAFPGWLLPLVPGPDTLTGPLTTSGPDAARRVLTAVAARWLAEGQLALREWWVDAPEPAEAHARYRRLRDALDALDALAHLRDG